MREHSMLQIKMTHLVAGCPFCRKVREAVTLLDLDVLFWPCPKDGPTYRPKAVSMSGKSQFPFLVDPNTGAFSNLWMWANLLSLPLRLLRGQVVMSECTSPAG